MNDSLPDFTVDWNKAGLLELRHKQSTHSRFQGMSDRRPIAFQPYKPWSLLRAFIVGAGFGIVLGAFWGFLDYGAWELGHFSNHVLGGLFIGGLGVMGLCAIRNWIRRNPI